MTGVADSRASAQGTGGGELPRWQRIKLESQMRIKIQSKVITEICGTAAGC